MLIVALRVPAAASELAADRLWSAGARAVEERELADGRAELRTSLGPDEQVARTRLGPTPTDWELVTFDVDDAPAETWRDFARPIRIDDHLVLQPAWRDDPVDPDELVVRIEPAGSFGLGDHPTTRLSAAATDRLVRVGDRVLDVGCGSGVLGIIAACRGAAHVVATDISEDAVVATRDNAALNGVADVVKASTNQLGSIDDPFDLVVANILAPTLVDLAADLRRLTDRNGRLVLSGVLVGGFDHVVRALAPMCIDIVAELDGWAAVVMRHPSTDDSTD